MEEALRAMLLATAAVKAIADGRVDWGLRPQGDGFPAVTLTVVSSIPGVSHDGPFALTEARVQVDCWGRTFRSAKLLKRAVLARLAGFAGTEGGVRFGGIFVAGDRDLDDADDIGPVFRTSLDLTVWHNA